MRRRTLRAAALTAAFASVAASPLGAAECTTTFVSRPVTSTVRVGVETYVELEQQQTLLGYDRTTTTTTYSWQPVAYERTEAYTTLTWTLLGFDRAEWVIVEWSPVHYHYVYLHINHYRAASGHTISRSCPGKWWWVEYPAPGRWDPGDPDCNGHGDFWSNGRFYEYTHHESLWGRDIYGYVPVFGWRWTRYPEPPGNAVYDWVPTTAYRTVRYDTWVPGSTPVYDWVPATVTTTLRYPSPPGTPVYQTTWVPVVRTRPLYRTITTIEVVPQTICVNPT